MDVELQVGTRVRVWTKFVGVVEAIHSSGMLAVRFCVDDLIWISPTAVEALHLPYVGDPLGGPAHAIETPIHVKPGLKPVK